MTQVSTRWSATKVPRPKRPKLPVLARSMSRPGPAGLSPGPKIAVAPSGRPPYDPEA